MNHAERNTDEVECDRCRNTVQLTEDGDVQDDGTVLWSGAQRGVCCGLLYAGAVWDGHVGVYELEEAGRVDDSPAPRARCGRCWREIDRAPCAHCWPLLHALEKSAQNDGSVATS